MTFRAFFLFIIIGLSTISNAFADTFTVSDIRIDGLRRISPGSVFAVLQIKIGDSADESSVGRALRNVYKTGYFQDAEILRDGNVLVVSVVERPAIGNIDVIGNELIEDEALLEGLTNIGLSEGRLYSPSLLSGIIQELELQYFSRGRYGLKVTPVITPMVRNRVSVKLLIQEGPNAKIKHVRIVGAKRYSESKIKGLFKLHPKRFWELFSSVDQYSREALSGDLETVKSHYLNNGFLNFKILSTQVSLSQDRTKVYLTVNIEEGEQFKFGEVKLAGDIPVNVDLASLIDVQTGDVFSQKTLVTIKDKITEKLSSFGYAFANVNAIPKLDEETKVANFVMFIDPGKPVYVRRINISGNVLTQDEVIRRELRQYEGALFSADKVKISKTRLNRLGFFETVDVKTPQVAGAADQVDVDINVTEKKLGQLQLGVGYGVPGGISFNGKISQDNVLGTGNNVSVAVGYSAAVQDVNVRFKDPYWTESGISRTYSLFWKETDAEEVDVSRYFFNSKGIDVQFGVPVTETDKVFFGIGIEQLELNTLDESPQFIFDYLDEYGSEYLNFPLTIGWSRNSTNRAIFATAGHRQRLSLEVVTPGSDLQYYKVTYDHRWFIPITENSSFIVHGELGYGDGLEDTAELPFFKNFFAGGMNTVRAFRGNSLGYRDENDDPVGGNVKIVGNIDVVFPVPFYPEAESVRMWLYSDIGNVYNTYVEDVDLDTLRSSAGIGLTWISPFGILKFAYGVPLREEENDRIENFQFTMGREF